jgi:hypothetical protein
LPEKGDIKGKAVPMTDSQFLRKGHILTLNDSTAYIRVSSGRLWITRENDGTDYVIESNESQFFVGAKQVVIQALVDTVMFYSAQNRMDFMASTQVGARSTGVSATTTGAASTRVIGDQLQF